VTIRAAVVKSNGARVRGNMQAAVPRDVARLIALGSGVRGMGSPASPGRSSSYR